MKFKSLGMSIIAAAMVLGSAGAVMAQSSMTPMPTGSAGNSNTGPGARPPMGADMKPMMKPRRHHMRRHTMRKRHMGMTRSSAPIRTGSAGNSNTGPGARPR